MDGNQDKNVFIDGNESGIPGAAVCLAWRRRAILTLANGKSTKSKEIRFHKPNPLSLRPEIGD
jgi:hypothetical protein